MEISSIGDPIHLCCLKKGEAEKVMEEIHQAICGPYMNGRMLAMKILRIGYYWKWRPIA